MRKVILYIFTLLAISFGAILGVLYPLRALLVNTNNDDPIPFAPQNQSSLLTSTPSMDDTKEGAISISSSDEVIGYNSPLPSEPLAYSSESDENSEKTVGGDLGLLVVDNQSVTIYSGIDEVILKNGPGWMPESALPGEDGMSVILGHRNRNHLKIIESVQVGDEISFRYLDGRIISYNVTEVQIFENSAGWVLPQSDGNMLVIVTCYPFRYSGSAPGKFQVVCKFKSVYPTI